MNPMSMSGGAMMSMTWMPMCGRSWMAAAVSFLGIWTVMMMAMMLPSLVPGLWRYHQAVGRAGRLSSVLLTVRAAAGYFLVWNDLGYDSTRVVNGTVIYCQHEQMTGSMVPKEDCISADAVRAEEQSRDESLRNLRQGQKVQPMPGS
ncbi:MAG: DUF2182 domain-containing protein [Steroidobacteraceae bacterium]